MSGPQPKASILEIQPYKAGKATAPGFEKPIKLSANENALGCSPRARAAYRDAEAALHLYPDPRANALRTALAAKHKLDPARIVFGTGSDEIFSMACQTFLSPGDNIVQPHYAFAAWAIAARAAGGAVKSAPEKNYHVDVDAMLAAVDAATRIVFIANPANPTGTRIPNSEIVRLHAALPQHVLLVLDGAYAEFAPPEAQDEWALFADKPNVLLTRTFSKLHGLAALRVGWGYGPAAIIDVLNRIRLPFNVPTPALAAAVAALDDDDFTRRSIAHAVRGREALAVRLAAFGLEPVPSASNFVTARVPAGARVDAAGLEQQLAARGIIVRGLANYDLADCIRITVGTEEQMQALDKALTEILA